MKNQNLAGITSVAILLTALLFGGVGLYLGYNWSRNPLNKNAMSQQPLQAPQAHTSVSTDSSAIVFSPDGNTLYVVRDDRVFKIDPKSMMILDSSSLDSGLAPSQVQISKVQALRKIREEMDAYDKAERKRRTQKEEADFHSGPSWNQTP